MILATLVCVAATSAPLQAALDWKETRLLLEPPTGAHEAAAAFEFTNGGDKPVRITDVRSGCGCTVSKPERELIEPGGRGSIRAVFSVGSKQGRQSVTITVFTDEGRSEPYALTLEVEIKEAVRVLPRIVYWKLGDELTTKTIRITLVEDFRFISAESASADFIVEVLPGEGATRELRVTPRDTWARRQGVIAIKIARGDAEPDEVKAWARVL